MSFSLLFAGLLGAALAVGMAVGVATLLEKLTFGSIRPRLTFFNQNKDDKGVDDLLEENTILRDRIYSLDEKNQDLNEDVEELHRQKEYYLLLSTRRGATSRGTTVFAEEENIKHSRDPSISSFNEDSPLAPRSGRRRSASSSPTSSRRRHHADGDLGDCSTRTNTRSRRYARVVEPSTSLSGRRTVSQSPARHLGIPGEVVGHGSITKKERRAREAARAAEWARKRKEKKTS